MLTAKACRIFIGLTVPLVACAQYHPMPLTPAAVRSGLAAPSGDELRVEAKSIKHPLLKPIDIEGWRWADAGSGGGDCGGGESGVAIGARSARASGGASAWGGDSSQSAVNFRGGLSVCRGDGGGGYGFADRVELGCGGAGFAGCADTGGQGGSGVGGSGHRLAGVANGAGGAHGGVRSGVAAGTTGIDEPDRAADVAEPFDHSGGGRPARQDAAGSHGGGSGEPRRGGGGAGTGARSGQRPACAQQALGFGPDAEVKLASGVTLADDVVVPSPGEILAGLEDRRLDLVALRLGYQSQEETLRAAVLAQFPKINIGFNRQRDNTNVESLGFAVTIDLPIFDRNQAAIATETATRQKLYDEYIERVYEARFDVYAAADDLAAISRQIREEENALPGLQRLADAYRGAFDRGDADVLSYYSALNGLAQKQLDILKLKQELMDTMVALGLAAGEYLTG